MTLSLRSSIKPNSLSTSSGALAIFVKTPELSPVKTRLASSIGPERALQFYEFALAATEAFASELQKRIPDLQVYWAVAEPDGQGAKRWNSFPVVSQGAGDLGSRLALVYESLLKSHTYVCFMGADSPHLEVETLSEAVRLTKRNSKEKFVIGETLDGGFYFFGGSISLPSSVWQDVEYSTDRTAIQLIQNLSGFGAVERIRENFDIDTIEDLLRCSLVLTGGAVYLPEQIELIQWSKTLFTR
ncbi:MAG: glycosyltransferase [Bdellovibrionales bacterium]|nr:glycosyltransferase [Bdellovibrionales bacterium]